MSARVLVVDDDPQMSRAVANALKAREHSVITASNGETALDLLSQESVDLVLLDVGLPGIDGHEVIRRFRGWSDTPVIMLSVQDTPEGKINALDSGADDYITKPFDTRELLARMRAVLRRSGADDGEPAVLDFGELVIDLSKQLVKLSGELIHLTPTEFRLLQTMAVSPGSLLTHRVLLQKVWGPGYATESNYLRLYVRQLRQKLGDDPARPRWITTEPGLGYRWLPEPLQPARD